MSVYCGIMIFYFSGTGNCRYVAERLGMLLGTEAVSMPGIMKDGRACADLSDELIGIVSPVYFYGLPTIVNEFISRTDLCGKKIFSVLTYGTKPGNASGKLRKELRKKRIGIDHMFEIKMPENYTPIFNVPSREVQDRLFREADERIKRIPELLDLGNYSEKMSVFAPLTSALLHPLYKYGRSTRKFKVTEDCTGCALCEKVCPIDAITVTDGRPQWNVKKCTRCIACIHRCPSSAIRLGRSHRHGQYLNPNVRYEWVE